MHKNENTHNGGQKEVFYWRHQALRTSNTKRLNMMYLKLENENPTTSLKTKAPKT